MSEKFEQWGVGVGCMHAMGDSTVVFVITYSSFSSVPI